MEATDQTIETALLQEALAVRWGLDFRRWRSPAFRRRVQRFAHAHGYGGPADLIPLVVRDSDWRDALVAELCRREGTLFREPDAWLAFRRDVVPHLRTWPRIRVWLPECAPGLDAWSLLVLLDEEGLLERSRVWATGMSERCIDDLRSGAWPTADFDAWAANHRASGGRDDLARRRAPGEGVRLDPRLLERVTFAVHTLHADEPHNTFQAIVCRDVLADYDTELTARVWRTLHASLVPFGVLFLGRDERIDGLPFATNYRAMGPGLWRRGR